MHKHIRRYASLIMYSIIEYSQIISKIKIIMSFVKRSKINQSYRRKPLATTDGNKRLDEVCPHQQSLVFFFNTKLV